MEHHCTEDNCIVAKNLSRAHQFSHRCLDTFGLKDLDDEHMLIHSLLDLLNMSDCGNGVKLCALVEVVCIGVEHFAEHGENEPQQQQGSTLVN